MARSNGPFGPAGTRPPARRHPADDPYAPAPGQAGGHNGQWPTAPYGNQQGQGGYHFPPEQEAPSNYDYGQQQMDPYANGMQPSYPPQQQWAQQPDPRGYDLGNYAPASQQPYPQVDPGQFRQPHDAFGSARQGYADPDAEYDDEDFIDDEPGGGRRWMFIAVVAIVGAVGVGGALAYTYKSLFAPSHGRVPVVRADQGNKAKPSEKVLGRLNNDAPQQAVPNSEPQDDRAGDDGGPRRVKTFSINPGAPMVPASPPPAPEVSPSMPGVMVDVGPRSPQAAPKNSQPPIAQQPPPARIAVGVPPPGMVPQAAPQDVQPQVEASPRRPQVIKAPPPPPPVKQAAVHPPPASTGAGWVAVLSSQKTRMDALKVFADLQQKYPDALNGVVPDVQEADLGEKGMWYRVVVGPPGSRDAANGVCGRLKSAGYASCWINSY